MRKEYIGKVDGATGVTKEIKMAKERNVPVFGVCIDDANTSSSLPDGLQRNRTIKLEWKNIASATEKMMKEEKNKI